MSPDTFAYDKVATQFSYEKVSLVACRHSLRGDQTMKTLREATIALAVLTVSFTAQANAYPQSVRAVQSTMPIPVQRTCTTSCNPVTKQCTTTCY